WDPLGDEMELGFSVPMGCGFRLRDAEGVMGGVGLAVGGVGEFGDEGLGLTVYCPWRSEIVGRVVAVGTCSGIAPCDFGHAAEVGLLQGTCPRAGLLIEYRPTSAPVVPGVHAAHGALTAHLDAAVSVLDGAFAGEVGGDLGHFPTVVVVIVGRVGRADVLLGHSAPGVVGETGRAVEVVHRRDLVGVVHGKRRRVLEVVRKDADVVVL